MKASVKYNDLIGTAAADINDQIAEGFHGNSLQGIGKEFNLDMDRFTVVGISIYGATNPFGLSLICKDKSYSDKEHIVEITFDTSEYIDLIPIIFKRLSLVLYEKHDEKYLTMDINETLDFDDINEDEE